MSRTLSARPRSLELAAEAAECVQRATVARGGRAPVLAAVAATEDVAALIYMEQLLKQAATAGFAVKKISLPATASEGDITTALERLSADADVAGIILQSPLPEGVDRTRVVTRIVAEKDIDGITAASAARLSAGDLDGALLPATAAAVMELLRAHQIEIRGRRAVVVGRSAVVGRPVAQLLALAGAHVEVVHSKTPDMGAVTRTAQILVVAAGVRALVRGEHVSPGCVVVDVGIHVQGDQIVGDVDEASVRDAVGETGALSPVPGGVGPMTNAILVLQAAQAALRLAGA
ncbi:MAG TPA: bifunctional 5,10-methylene-tetrahydrofolate dehydrogenase/5,10-methylene-tetrahydrofolate cyclohydrolase [Chloroflexi bacterium]|nr:bifunctional 5,10-methylene-tetrahydrofolate dehydrogenase/5,10-methylene-tetrahydrofolate cyclohydrolase [Chloroflexota bacterium]